MPNEENRTVYSTELGDLRKIKDKQPPPQKAGKQQTIYLHRESKGRGGKVVTLVKNLILSEVELKLMAKNLKQLCGTGGTLKDEVIEIQGDHREKIANYLLKAGYKVKIAGG